jgi:hypothetical protein
LEAWLARVRAYTPPHRFSELNAGPDLPSPTPYELGRAFRSTLELPDPVMPLLPPDVSSEYPLTCVREPPSAFARRHLAVQTVFGGSGISTRCPSPTAFALGLGPTNPERTSLAQETLAIRCVRFPLTFRYSCRHSHFRSLQQSFRSAFTASGTLPYQSPASKLGDDFATSVQRLSPVKFSARDHLTSELLRTLSMMAASEPTSWLFMQSHIVHHLALI